MFVCIVECSKCYISLEKERNNFKRTDRQRHDNNSYLQRTFIYTLAFNPHNSTMESNIVMLLFYIGEIKFREAR